MRQPMTWEASDNYEKAVWVRKHIFSDSLQITEIELMKLFNLTDEGLEAIRNGSDWRPEFKAVT